MAWKRAEEIEGVELLACDVCGSAVVAGDGESLPHYCLTRERGGRVVGDVESSAVLCSAKCLSHAARELTERPQK